jgi:CysZ protein
MFNAARLALLQILSPPFRAVLWKSIGITLLVLIGGWFAIEALLSSLVAVPFAWLNTLIAILAGLGMIVGMFFLIAPVTVLVAGLFLDEVAEAVEAKHYPQDPVGTPVPFMRGLWLTIRFTLLTIAVNIVAFLLFLLPGINVAVFFIANGYLLGREFFQQAALRFHGEREANALRRQNGVTIFLSGLLIAGFLAIPILNLLGPLFATAFMVHMHKRLVGRAPSGRRAYGGA